MAPAKILLVDDDTELSKVLATRLVRRGFEVHQALGVEEATHLFDSQKGDFRAILCDYHIGQQTGLDVYDHVTGRNFVGRFVIMSGDDVPNERVLLLCQTGKCSQLLKPFELGALVELIGE